MCVCVCVFLNRFMLLLSPSHLQVTEHLHSGT